MSHKNEIISSIRDYLFETFLLGYNENEFSNDRSFYEIGVFDSIGVLEMVTYIENIFDIRFEEEEIIPENISTISKIADFIIKKSKIKEEGMYVRNK